MLSEILKPRQWDWHGSQGCRQALQLLSSKTVGVLICAQDLPDGHWEDLLLAGGGLTVPPSVIVCSRAADECLWAEVLNLGGYDVLIKPFDRQEVLRVTSSAWQCWKRQSRGSAGSRLQSAANGPPPAS